MKKLLIFLCSIFLSFHVLSCDFHNKREYTTKNKKVLNVPKVMEFFSFFCPYCFEFEKTHNIRNLIKKNIKKNIKIQRYHVNFLGGKLSFILTKAWIMAQQMGIEEKIIMPIFEGIQEKYTINNLNNIKKLFLKEAQINEDQYNKFWNSLGLKILVKKNNQDIKKSKLDHVPEMIINGKYIIEYDKVEDFFKNNFTEKYIELINYLLDKK